MGLCHLARHDTRGRRAAGFSAFMERVISLPRRRALTLPLCPWLRFKRANSARRAASKPSGLGVLHMEPTLIAEAALSTLHAEHAMRGRWGRLARWAFSSTAARWSRVRVSVAAVLSIEIAGRFVLVEGQHRKDLGPPGGVRKYTPNAIHELRIKLGFRSETARQGNEGDMDHDLRGYIRGKHFNEFRHFVLHSDEVETSKDALWREMVEELHLPIPRLEELRKDADLVRLRRVEEGFRRVRGAGYLQYRLIDVYTLSGSRKAIEQFAAELREKAKVGDVVLATAEEISKHRLSDGRLIGSQADYLIQKKSSGYEPPPP